MDDELHERLERMGRAAAPRPDEQFAARLESHLRATAATPPERHRGPVLLRPGLVLGALLLVALAVGALVLGGDDADVLVIDDAAGATIVVPGGEPVTGAPGTELPDGTVIEVGPEGFAVIDGIVLPAGSEATVVMGVVELRLTSPTPAPTAVAPTVTVESTPTSAPTATPQPTTAPTSTPQPVAPNTDATPDTPVATPEPEPEPTPTARPTTAPSATPTAQPTATPQPTPTGEPEPTPTAEARPTVTLERANLGPRRTQLSWTVTGADAIAGFEVRIRRGDEIRTAAVLRDPAARQLTVERPQRDRVFYRVVARNAEGEVVARSNEVRVTAPG